MVFFRLYCHWHEREVALKTAFRLNARDAVATYDVPFGASQRPADGLEVPAHRWADWSGPAGGAALLNRGSFGHDAQDGTMRITLLRGISDLDPLADEGEHEFVYALYPHDGDWRMGEVVRRGMEFNLPSVAAGDEAPGVISPGARRASRLPCRRAGAGHRASQRGATAPAGAGQGPRARSSCGSRGPRAGDNRPHPVRAGGLVENRPSEQPAEGRVEWQDKEITVAASA